MPISNESTRTLKAKLQLLKAEKARVVASINQRKADLRPFEDRRDQIQAQIDAIKLDVSDD